jgi:ubiquinone/menaquinone biosynthesis C-methylase UbiE
MSTPSNQNPKPEQPSTYFVQDRANIAEMERLLVQDRLSTATMGGVLPEQPDAGRFQHVLDVGCGTGGWLIELAKTYPGISRLVGVDISHTMIAYARTQAEANQVGDRVEFHVMDALRMLEFPARSFDLVNHRFGISWLRTWDWPKLLQEYQRVARPEGVVRITEAMLVESSSQALMRLDQLSIQALFQAGHLFANSRDGLTGELPRLLRQHGLRNVQTRACDVVYGVDTVQGQRFIEDMTSLYRVIQPFLQKWIRLPDDYNEIYQQARQDMQQPDFIASGSVLTAWGNVPSTGGRSESDQSR